LGNPPKRLSRQLDLRTTERQRQEVEDLEDYVVVRTRTTSGSPKPSGTASFNRLGESLAGTLHKGDHVLVDGQLVSKKYENENGKSKKAKAAKVTIFWSVRANSVRRLSRAEAEIPTQAPSAEAAAESSEAPF
jgi:single-stranded DNA-binding protein